MNIRISVYDFFAYTVPGGLYLVILLFLLGKYQVLAFDYWNITTVQFILLTGVAYILGVVGDLIASNFWYWLFRPKDFFNQVMLEFNQRNSRVQVEWKDMDWFILISYIRKHDHGMAADVEHLNVLNIMFRNISFSFLICSILSTIEYLEHGYKLSYAVFGSAFIISSIILVKRAVKFQKWFFQAIYQSTIALTIQPEQLPVKIVEPIVKQLPDRPEREASKTSSKRK